MLVIFTVCLRFGLSHYLKPMILNKFLITSIVGLILSLFDFSRYNASLSSAKVYSSVAIEFFLFRFYRFINQWPAASLTWISSYLGFERLIVGMLAIFPTLVC